MMDTDEEQHAPLNTIDVVDTWLAQYNEGTLTADALQSYWLANVPDYYSPSMDDNCLTWDFNEEQAYKALFDTLERFICGGESVHVLSTVYESEKPSSVCGRVFKIGEPTYSCRECGVDNTCVLCVQCFTQSEHKFHKYRMGNSGGGGCCDCGDVEAWKQSPWCAVHFGRVDDSNDATSSARHHLPEHLCDRSRIVIDALLWYAFDHLNNGQLISVSEHTFNTDLYCTILYNDESHTFDQVIGTLTRVKLCQQRTAIEFVTNIDREGRSVVKCSTFAKCNEFKQEVEKHTSRHGNRPLNVVVTHAHVLAYQIFALKLLNWLQNLLNYSKSLRAVFAELALKRKPPQSCIIKGVLLGDSKLWKNARTHWQRLLISGMLFEYENKKALATIFTKNYGSILKDFIKDDHDHSYSISSLSVQLFTVPTLAHHLIAENDVLYVLLNTFMSECMAKCNKAGKLEFDRSPAGQSFKRAQYILYDLRYILSSIPQQWTDDLRRNFLHGLQCLLELLKKMQGMDPFLRLTGQHIEYEPEWESAFNLHIKLAYCISLAITWCGTDKIVLVKAYRAVLNALNSTPCTVQHSNDVWELFELADHSASCLVYDVASKPVSIHLPLSRILAGLHLHLDKFGLHFDSGDFQNAAKPNPVQIVEPVLRCLVMIAQVHSGMWRRNGYALINQLYYYHNVKCRTEMYDRDICLLQTAASLIESNEFLIHVLHKFNLLQWASLAYEKENGGAVPRSAEEDQIRQNISLVEEFLQLIIVIVSERHIPGIANCTVEDRIKKEIIQHLAVKPLAHSELNKIIPDDISHETAIDNVINDLADFKAPLLQSSGKGVYELRSQFYNDYNVFYYHYTREELSKSEERQRMRRKTAGQLECCPPAAPIKLSESFCTLVNLLQCDVMLHLMQIVLERFSNLQTRSTSEQQLHKVLHLIGLALLEEESQQYSFFKFIQNAAKFNLQQYLIALLECKRVDAQQGLLRWTIEKYRSLAHNQDGAIPEEPHPEVVAEKIPRIDTEKERRARLAAEHRAKIMSQMMKLQQKFMKGNPEMFEQSANTTEDAPSSAMELCNDDDVADDNDVTTVQTPPIAVGVKQTIRPNSEKAYTCILCQETTICRNDTTPTMVLAAFIQHATVLCITKKDEENELKFYYQDAYLNYNLGPAPHVNTCGHVMHNECWKKYFDNVMSREHRRLNRLRHPSSFDVDKHEFLCPLCECLSNTVIPLVAPLIEQTKTPQSTTTPDQRCVSFTYDDWLLEVRAMLKSKVKTCHGVFQCTSTNCPNEHCSACLNVACSTVSNTEIMPIQTVCPVNCTLESYQVFQTCNLNDILTDNNDTFSNLEAFKALFPTHCPQLNAYLQECLKTFTHVTFVRDLLFTVYSTNDKSYIQLLWKSLAYTIHSIEVLLKDSNKPLAGSLSSRQRDSLECLVRVVALVTSSYDSNTVINHFAVQLLSFLFENPTSGKDIDEIPFILEWDSLGILIPLTFSMPSLNCQQSPIPIPNGGVLDHHLLRTIFLANIVKAVFLTKPVEVARTTEDDNDDDDDDDDDDEEMLDSCRPVIDLECKCNFKNVLCMVYGRRRDYDMDEMWRQITAKCRPFLRCCCLFYHFLTDVPMPAALHELHGDTFSNMCTYLDVPQTYDELFATQNTMNLVGTWCSHPYVHSSGNLAYERNELQMQLTGDHRLIDLPTDYSELINAVSTFTCPSSDEISRNPTMCMVCGEILCSQAYCCQTEMNKMNVGACNFHAFNCGSGVGLFLRIKDCEVLLLAPPHRGCFIAAPYIDDYGETDEGLKRGNPLKLCTQRYKKLQTLWLSHSIHEEIARSMETNSHVISMQWNHL